MATAATPTGAANVSIPEAPKTIKVPPQWPDAVVEKYEPIRILGKGGFASVMLARQKKLPFNYTDGQNNKVAIKVVGSKDASRQEHGYAHREVDILRELQHANIMKIYDFWETPRSSSTTKEESSTDHPGGGCAAVMALSYCPGPTLESLINHGGAVSLPFGCVVMAQLIDALAYCHGRAVIHRDIKPDNIVITGAAASQDEIWDNPENGMPTRTTTANNNKAQDDWPALRKKWHVTLIDFGFARALGPDDLEKEKVTMKPDKSSGSNSKRPSHTAGSSSIDQSQGSVSSSRHSTRSSVANASRHSVSFAMTRKMSALGNRMYAAPEIINGVQDRPIDNNSAHHLLTFSSRHSIDITRTLSQHVSNYGMLADAFSLGNTLQYMMTGVPPKENVSEFIRNLRSPMAVLFQFVGSYMCASSKSTNSNSSGGKRHHQYRGWKELPAVLGRLIRGMTHPGVSQRTSVRAARRYPFIDNILQNSGEDGGVDVCSPATKMLAEGKIDFLKCTMRGQHHKLLEEVIDETIVLDDQVGLEL